MARPNELIRDAGVSRRLVWIVLVLGSGALVATSVYRAASSSFTVDESLSFAIFNWAPKWGHTANNHLLNTWLMQLCSWLLGNSELSLRSPNIVAHVIYLVSTLLLLRRLERSLIRVLGFILLSLNPFLLDFFSLARGYGLALGFLMLSLYLLARAHGEKPGQRRVMNASLSGVASALAVLANFSFLTYFVPMLLVTTWVVASDDSCRRIRRDRLAAAAALLGAGGIFGGFVLYKLLLLRRAKELYFGGHKGFFSDTVEGLVRASAYSNTVSRPLTATISVVLLATALAVLAVAARQFRRQNKVSLALVFAAVLAGAAALPIVERYLFHVLWPIERAAVYYIPLYVVAVLFGVQLLTGMVNRHWKVTGVLTLPTIAAVLLCVQFARHFDPHSTFDWAFDRHDKEAIGLISRDHANSKTPSRLVTIGVSWQMEPSLNFYRTTRHYTWLAPVKRRSVNEVHYDYFYGFATDVNHLRDHSVKLALFADTNTLLVRIDR